MQLKTIKVYGRLRKFLGSSYFKAAVSSPAEAIRFLMCNFPEIETHMSKQYYKVKMNNIDVSLDFLSISGKGDIQIIPIATGSEPNMLITGHILNIGAAITSASVGGVTSITGAAVADLVEDGVTFLIAPTPQITLPPIVESTGADLIPQNDIVMPDLTAQKSFGFSAITNVSRTGVAVPIIYGEVFTGSVVISAGTDTVQIEGTAA